MNFSGEESRRKYNTVQASKSRAVQAKSSLRSQSTYSENEVRKFLIATRLCGEGRRRRRRRERSKERPNTGKK